VLRLVRGGHCARLPAQSARAADGLGRLARCWTAQQHTVDRRDVNLMFGNRNLAVTSRRRACSLIGRGDTIDPPCGRGQRKKIVGGAGLTFGWRTNR
jgi:hypothetical protein